MRRIIYFSATILLAGSIAFGPSSARAQSDTAWTRERAAKWFAGMDWFKGGTAAPVKKKYDSFGRELEDESADTTSKAVVNANLQPGTPVNMVEFARQYHANPSRWDKAFAYLKNTDFSALQPGRYPIDGDDVYAMITFGPPKKMDDTTTWESHRNFEDIHYVISGKEKIGIIPLSEATVVRKYDSGHDLAGYSAKGSYYVATPGIFFIITTEEAHRPGIREEGCDLVKKLYIKVRKS
ncbi:MAG TPA: YhcH/YjgK/YiaL family protein [Puia sp.]|jgi:YhcH/YjgK/YiaL family protein